MFDVSGVGGGGAGILSGTESGNQNTPIGFRQRAGIRVKHFNTLQRPNTVTTLPMKRIKGLQSFLLPPDARVVSVTFTRHLPSIHSLTAQLRYSVMR